MAENIIGIMAQRLIRKLCPQCKEAYEPSEPERRLLGIRTSSKVTHIYRAKGCVYCEEQGFKGRTALMEILKFDSDLDELLVRGATASTILRTAREKGFKSLADIGVHRVLQGVTSLDEISRVIDLTHKLK